jgi:hypothetical protein
MVRVSSPMTFMKGELIPTNLRTATVLAWLGLGFGLGLEFRGTAGIRVGARPRVRARQVLADQLLLQRARQQLDDERHEHGIGRTW